MPPHGPGCVGNMHSHDAQYPDDNWNLYAMLDPAGTTALNVTRPDQSIGIFKTHVHRFDPLPEVISDADEDFIVRAIFTSPVHIRKIMVIGGGEHSQHPSQLQCFVNHDDIDFTNVSFYNPIQQYNLLINEEGITELIYFSKFHECNFNHFLFSFKFWKSKHCHKIYRNAKGTYSLPS